MGRDQPDPEGLKSMDYPDIDQLPPALREAVTSRGSLNVYRMVTHSPGLSLPFLAMADAIFQGNTLPADLRELAIIRVGRRCGAEYEHHHHERIGFLVGLSETAIASAATGDTDGLTDTEASVIRWTDALLDRHRLDDDEVAAALEVFTTAQLADFVLTVGFYEMVSGFLSTFGVTTDGETPPF